MTLAEAQAAFHALVTGPPEGRRERAAGLLAGTPALSAEARAGVYADMWLWRQVEALRADFPAVAALVGDDGSFRLFEAYLRAHPSEDPDIGRLGRLLAAWLAEQPAAAPRPDLADLAALEWARQEAFFAAPAAPLGREALAAVAPEAFPALRLRLVPSLRLLRLAHDVAGPFEA
ncbi:MAG TPA: putative DNA-binding domain-containing protein, partial [Anaeromyxobacteraceae bacterium]|nr:putative DNA-binding domain-containing protein [Anaeromyxobacteraceae bacterium]